VTVLSRGIFGRAPAPRNGTPDLALPRDHFTEAFVMPFLETRDHVRLFYNDWGSGKPVILVHGWPLDSDMWSDQAVFLASRGLRTIAYDRRGFGRSDQPWDGYDYDTLAADLAAVIEGLDLDSVALVGFSMGGGEVARYLGRHGSARVRKAALVSAVTPFLLKTTNNPDGVDQAVFDAMLAGLADDRPHFLADFGKTFFGNGLIEKNVSTEMLAWTLQMAMTGSLRATQECAKAFATTDFRPDLAAFDIPTLIIHGDADKTVPIDSSARPAARLIKTASLVEYAGEPHGLHATAKQRLGEDLLAFLS
jgi:pimeloyl-ACP methyl ester carboxylesterase